MVMITRNKWETIGILRIDNKNRYRQCDACSFHAMASMHNKLCSCLGFAHRLAKKNHVDPEVCGYQQTALFTLTEGQRRDSTKVLERRILCLAESLGIQSAPSGGTCLEEPSCRISELSSKLATMRLEFQEGLAALKGSREAMNSSKQKSLPCARNAPSYTASMWQWRQRAAKETHTKVFQQLASKLAPMVVDHHVAPDADSSDCRTGGAKRLVDPIYPAEAS